MCLPQRWRDKQRRTLDIACLSLAVNLLFALAHGTLGVVMRSGWYLSLGAYYAVLSVMRFGVLRMASRPQERSADRFMMRFCGGMLMLLAVAFGVSVAVGLIFDRANAHHEIIMISLATYTFYKLTLAIINICRTRSTAVLRTLRGIACADAAASLASMQRSMIVTFGGMRAATLLNALTGGCVCLFVLALGIGMLLEGGQAPGGKNGCREG